MFLDSFVTFVMVLILAKSLADLWKESKTAVLGVVSIGTLVVGFLVYDHDKPTTGLAAFVYPDHVIESRIEAKKEAEKLKEIVAKIKEIYAQPLFTESELMNIEEMNTRFQRLKDSIDRSNEARELMKNLREV